MPQFSRQWLAAFLGGFLVCVAGYAVDLHVMQIKHDDLVANEAGLRRQLYFQQQAELAKANQKNRVTIPRRVSLLMQEFLGMVAANQLELQGFSINTSEKTASAGVEFYQVALTGSFLSCIDFFLQLASIPDKYAVSHFDIRVQKDYYLAIEMLLRVKELADKPEASAASGLTLTDPFCVRDVGIPRILQDDKAVQFPLASLRMRGTIAQLNKLDALIQFPDGVTSVISLDSPLGSEGGRVVAVNSRVITVQKTDKTLFYIYRNQL